MRVSQPVPAPHRSQAPPADPVPSRHRPLAVQGAGLVLIAVLTMLHGSWAAQVLLIPVLLIDPGAILLGRCAFPARPSPRTPSTPPPRTGPLVLTGPGARRSDLTLLHSSGSRPARGATVWALSLICAVCLCSVNAPEFWIPWDSLSRPASSWPLLLPLLAAVGALRLNSGHGDHVAVLALTVVVVAPVAAFCLAADGRNTPGVIAVRSRDLRRSPAWYLSSPFHIQLKHHSLHQTVSGGWQFLHFAHPDATIRRLS